MNAKPPIFIGGAGRSGTTLLRVILDSHPNIACGPEFKFTPILTELWYQLQNNYKQFSEMFNEYHISDTDIDKITGDMLISFLDKYRISQNKQRIAEKSPNNILVFFQLHRILPQSPLIHMVRDGRDVVASLLSMDWKDINGNPVDYTTNAIKAAKYWRHIIEIGYQFSSYNLDTKRYFFQLKYEDIVLNPIKTLKGLFDFINEPWNDEVLSYHTKNRNLLNESSANQVNKMLYSSSIGRWKKDLTSEQKELIKPLIGDLLIKLDYEKNMDW